MRKLAWTAAFALTMGACGGGDGDSSGDSGRFRVSGTLTVAERVTVDSDVNDPGTALPGGSFASNDDPDSAQVVFSPGTTSGFASAEPTGTPGSPLAEAADPDDWYRIRLAAGQVLTLRIADFAPARPEDPDLDLYLYDADQPDRLVDASLGLAATESLAVPGDGSYLVRVNAYRGGSAYTLGVGDGAAAATTPRRHTRLSDDFVPGEAITRFRAMPRKAQPLTAMQQSMGIRAGDDTGLALVGMPLPLYPASGDTVSHPRAGRVPAALADRLDTLLRLKALASRPDVVRAEPNYRVQVQRTPNDPLYDRQWHYPLIALPRAWDVTVGDAAPPVTVAVLDTGVVLEHPDLAGQLAPGYDFIRDPELANDGDGIDADPDDPGDASRLREASWHGTHVAGTVAAASNNGSGVAGTSWAARIMPVRAIGIGGGTLYDVIQGMRYAAGLSNDSGTTPTVPADIINLSIGGTAFSDTLRSQMELVRGEGVMLLAAAGNDGSTVPHYPAAFDAVVSVSAVGPDADLAYYANRGPSIDLVAPGGSFRQGSAGGVLSTYIDPGNGARTPAHAYLTGTSMAVPHVAGVFALMKAVNPDLTPADVDNLISSGAITDDLGDPGRDDRFGHGLINAFKAVNEARRLAGAGDARDFVVAQPGRVDLGLNATSAVLTLTAEGDEPASVPVTAVTVDADWLRVAAADADANGHGEYAVTITDRERLPGTEATATISVAVDGADDLTIPVSAQRSLSQGERSAGNVYVAVFDAGDPDPAVRLTRVGTAGGSAEWAIADLPAGEYYVVAGTDVDGDARICDAGEVCGAYPTRASLDTVSVDGDRSGLDLLLSPASGQVRGSTDGSISRTR